MTDLLVQCERLIPSGNVNCQGKRMEGMQRLH